MMMMMIIHKHLTFYSLKYTFFSEPQISISTASILINGTVKLAHKISTYYAQLLIKRRNPVNSVVFVFRNRKTQVILGAHSISKHEPEKQKMSIKKDVPYPCYDNYTHEGDLKLLKVRTFDCTFD